MTHLPVARCRPSVPTASAQRVRDARQRRSAALQRAEFRAWIGARVHVATRRPAIGQDRGASWGQVHGDGGRSAAHQRRGA